MYSQKEIFINIRQNDEYALIIKKAGQNQKIFYVGRRFYNKMVGVIL